jgi:hypothetical protein
VKLTSFEAFVSPTVVDIEPLHFSVVFGAALRIYENEGG